MNVRVPLGVLAGIVPEPFEWLVPGMLSARVEAMVRSLPKRLRRKLAPVPDHVREVMPVLLSPAIYRRGSLSDAVADVLEHQFGVMINPSDWDFERLDPHLNANFQVRGKRRKLLGQSRNLTQMQESLLAEQFSSGADARAKREQHELSEFPPQGVPARMHLRGGGEQLVYPALRDDGERVSLIMCPDASSAAAHNRTGYPRLARITDTANQRYLLKLLRANKRLGLYYTGFGSAKQLEDRVLNHLYWNKFFADQPLPETAEDFVGRLQGGRQSLVRFYHAYEQTLIAALSERFEIVQRLEELRSPAYVAAVADITQQLDDLFGEQYPQQRHYARFQATPGYLRGIVYRLDHLQGRVSKDERAMQKLSGARTRLLAAEAALKTSSSQGANSADLELLWVGLEEWRLALFAQPLALHNGMSDKKLTRRLEGLETRLGLR